MALGRYTAGVIELHTAPPPSDRFALEFEIDALRASGLVVVPLPEKRGSVAIALRRSYFELILPLITDSVRLSYTDYQLRLDYRLTDDLRTVHSLLRFARRARDAPANGSDQRGRRHQHRLALRLRSSDRWHRLDAEPCRQAALVGHARALAHRLRQ